MVLSSEIVGVIVGGALAIVSGIIITYFIKVIDEKKIKKNAIRALLGVYMRLTFPETFIPRIFEIK